MKRLMIGMAALLFTASAYAQFEQLLQSVKNQVADAAQRQVTEGMQTATDVAVNSAQTRARQVIETTRHPAPAGAASGTTAK